jgi:hypothetical protein
MKFITERLCSFAKDIVAALGLLYRFAYTAGHGHVGHRDLMMSAASLAVPLIRR